LKGDSSDSDSSDSDSDSSSGSSSNSSCDSSDSDSDCKEKGGSGWLPAPIVIPVLLAGQIFQLMIISLIGTGFQLFLWSYILLDRLWDTIVRLFLGQIFFLKPFAWLAIWAFKIPTFPIIIFGWVWTILTELMAFPVSGWMILFGGSGCFLRWGYNCHFPNGKRIKDRGYWQIADLAWLLKNPQEAYTLPPSYNQFSQEMMKVQGQERRASLAAISPLSQAQYLVSDIA